MLIEWSKLIELHDPDIIIGYNTFGFDESFMYDRITDLAMNDIDRLVLNKDDLHKLDTNYMYQKFINLGRFDNEIIKKVPDMKGRIINKQLSSSALGDNFMYYFNIFTEPFKRIKKPTLLEKAEDGYFPVILVY